MSPSMKVRNNGAWADVTTAGRYAKINGVMELLGATPPSENLIAWFKADELGLANNEVFDTWPDATNNGNDAFHPTAGQQPKYLTNVQNGLGVVSFNTGAGNALGRLFFPTGMMTGVTAATFILVHRITLVSSQRQGPLRLTSNGEDNHYHYTNGSTYENLGSSVRKQFTMPVGALTAMHVYSVITASNDWRAYKNKTLAHTVGTNTVGFTAPLGMGAQTLAYQGEFAELMIFDEALSDVDRNGYEDDLIAKWAIV